MPKLLDQLFPLRHIRNIAMFYVLSSAYNMWFVSAVWVFIWGRFMTTTQMGISDSITFTLGFLVELPSGVFADIIGRKKAILMGSVMLALGNFLISASSSFYSLTFWYLIWTIGYAFQSGATEALAYDSLKQKGLQAHWNEVMTSSTIIAKVTTLIATALGGILFAVGFRLPYLAAGCAGLIAVAAAWGLQEIAVQRVHAWSLNMYLNQVKDGLRTLIKPQVVSIAVISLTIISIGYMYNWGILRPFTGARFGYTPANFGFLLAVVSLSSIMSMPIFRWMKKRLHIEKHIYLLSLTYGGVFLILGYPHKLLDGGLLMIGLAILLTHLEILFSQFINEHTEAQHRATTLSAVTLFTKMPYVLLALAIGKIAETPYLPLYTRVVGAIALIVWGLSYLSRKEEAR